MNIKDPVPLYIMDYDPIHGVELDLRQTENIQKFPMISRKYTKPPVIWKMF